MDVKSALRVATAMLEYKELKDKQKEAIKAFASRKDVFVSLPTGYGKLLCYQILPVLFDALRNCTKNKRACTMVITFWPIRLQYRRSINHLLTSL